MIGALGLFKRRKRRRVLMLPIEPSSEPVDGLHLCRSGAVDPESLAGIDAFGLSDPLAVSLCGNKAVLALAGGDFFHKSPNRCGLVAANIGSTRFSSIASATSRAVSADIRTPFL